MLQSMTNFLGGGNAKTTVEV